MELENPPLQTAINHAPFNVEVNAVNYQVQPLYDCALYGLVVSYAQHDGDTMLHKLWNDHLNTTDVCVVWSNSAFDLDLNDYSFWNGQFTCNIKTSDSAAWARFDMNQLPNNHLLSNDKAIRNKIKNISVGDQIYIKGWLSEYASEGGGKRDTSITREDTGNGACETIFITEFEILRASQNLWRKLMYLSLFLFLGTIAYHLLSPYQPHA
ncbi:MAG: hypothetical protein AB9Q18_05060 [Candidatus Reddybacter sp.]